jgi:hypothetical protein
MKSLQKVSLLKQERAAVETLQQAVPIERVILFGSKARGDADDCSDFDLLLLTARPLHWTEEKAIVETLFCPHTVPDMCTGLRSLRGERSQWLAACQAAYRATQPLARGCGWGKLPVRTRRGAGRRQRVGSREKWLYIS